MAKVRIRTVPFGFGTIQLPVPTRKERFMTIKKVLRNPKLKKRLKARGEIFE